MGSGAKSRISSTKVKRRRTAKGGMGDAASKVLRKWASDISVRSECEVRF